VIALQKFNWLPALSFIAMLGLLTLVAATYFFLSKLRSPLPPPLPTAGATLEGLRGWLILPAIGMLLRPIFIIVLLVQLLPTVLNAETWSTLTTPGAEAYHPRWAAALLFELFANGGLLIFNLLLLALFFRNRSAWPRAFATFLALNVLVAVIDYQLTSGIPAVAAQPGVPTRDITQTIIAAAIWIPYCFKSQRVRATFRR
jgi:hypothetical protein